MVPSANGSRSVPSERQTEALVRDHFAVHGEQVTIEEQASESPRIAKLLRGASKSGPGPGRPDFIVQFRNEPDLLAVVECKADISRHESATRDDFAHYAVDGASTTPIICARDSMCWR